MKFIIIFAWLIIKISCVHSQDPTTTTNATTTLPVTQAPTTAPTTEKTGQMLKTELEKRVSQIKADISTQATAVVDLESVSTRIRNNLKTSTTVLATFKTEMAANHQNFDNNFELKVFLDEVDREMESANTAYLDILHKLNKIICIE